MPRQIRLLSVIEASTITGPAKNLLDFGVQAKTEVDLSILTFTRGEERNLFTDRVREAGLRVLTVDESGALDPRVLTRLRTEVGDLAPDLIQTHAVKSHFLARLARLHRMAPWVAFHHGYTWPSLRAQMYNQLDRWSLRAPAKVLTVSVPFREELVARGVERSRIEIIHNAIRPGWGQANLEGALQLRSVWKIPPDRNVILIVGRLSKEKDHITLLRAVAQLPAHHRAHLVLIGEGPERSRIESEAVALGIQDRVVLTGQQPSAEPFYAIAQVAVLSSLSEGSPNALLEAMSAGVPAVATRVGGVPEIVTDGESALLIEPTRVEEMRNAIQMILENPSLAARLVSRSRELIQSRHTPQARADSLVKIYRELVRL